MHFGVAAVFLKQSRFWADIEVAVPEFAHPQNSPCENFLSFHYHIPFDVMVDMASDVLLNGVIHPDIRANLAEDLVPRAAYVFTEIPFEGGKSLVRPTA